VRELIRRRLHQQEQGATLVIVALCLIALVGMVVLVVDVGGLLLNRREMVNASDAAALSAAKSCVLPTSKDTYPDGLIGAEQAADALAGDNSNGANVTNPNNIIRTSGCDTAASGYVTVEYGANQQLFFAGIFGRGQGHVTTDATAVWGPPGSANPLPIVLYQNSFNNCKLNEKIDPTKTCYVWEDNNNVAGSQSAFGLLDLRRDNPSKYGWDSNAGAGCSAPGNSSKDGPQAWIHNYPSTDIGDLPVNYPAATYVCRIAGFQQSTWSELDRLKDDDDSVDHNDAEDIVYFPINRCEETVPNANVGGQLRPNSVLEAACPETPGQYDIIGFAAMKIEEIYRKGDLGVSGASGACPNNATLGTAGPGLYGQGGWNLDSIAIAKCGAPSAPPTITGLSITSGNGRRMITYNQCTPTTTTATCDYVWDVSTHTLSWFKASTRPGADTYNVHFSWTMPGVCGIPPSNSASGHCLVLLPVEVQLGGSNPGAGSPDSNLRATKLCEPAIAGSCGAVPVPNP